MKQRYLLLGLALPLAVLASFGGAAEPITAEQARVLVTGPGFNRPDPFPGRGEFSWPGNIAKLPDGELLFVHSAGYYHVSFAQPRLIEPETRKRWLSQGWPLDFSAPTGGRSMIVRSRDGGRTWSKPQAVIDFPLDDSPCGLVRCHDGTLVCCINVQASWYGYSKAPTPFAKDIDGLNTQQCVVRSSDNGVTWSEPIWLKSPGDFYERSHAQPIVLPGGEILWPTYFMRQDDPVLYGAIHRSDDHGRTWRTVSIVTRKGNSSDTASPESGNIDEPAIARLSNGRLFLITRPDGGRFFSSDQGKTWKFDGQLVTQGKFKAPRLFVLKDDTIVCLATYSRLVAFIGRDGGQDWVGPVPVDPSAYGYPGGLMLEDESILVSYCSSGSAPNSLYVLRLRVNAARDGVELLPIAD